jgi:hypothetical protein
MTSSARIPEEHDVRDLTNYIHSVILKDDMLDELVQTRISRQLKAGFEAAAQREGLPASEILRLLITEWMQRMHPELLKEEGGGGFRVPEASAEQETSPTQAVCKVLCWHCHGWIEWRMELGPQGFCPYCGAFIDLRVR